MLRFAAAASTLLAVMILAGPGEAGAKQKPQMVKGTVKVVDVSKDLLIVNQKVKNEVVDRELSILDSTEFVVMINGEKKEGSGKNGLRLLEGREGASVAVKCDKDVNVLKVTVTVTK